MYVAKRLLWAILAVALLLFPAGCGVFDGDSGGNGSGNGGGDGVVIGERPLMSNYEFTVGLQGDGTLWAWGYNGNGQLGDGTTDDKLVPTKIGADTDWVSVALGWYHTVASKSDGTIWSWGYGGDGAVGQGSDDDVLVPTQVGDDDDWASIHSYGYHTVALKMDGTIWAWGYNGYGEIGNGSYDEDVLAPIQIGDDDDWVFIVGGDEFTFAIKTDGTLWGWGDSSYGALGNGSEDDDYLVPTQIGTDDDWAFISPSYDFALALKTDGTLWGWGDNYYGQVGNGGNDEYVLVPTQVGTDTDWVLVSAGGYNSAALKTDGSLYTWGENYYWQLGDGTTEDRHVPTQVGTDTDWAFVSAGYEQTVAIKMDGTLWGWGYNGYGELGDGTTDDIETPTQIGSVTDWGLPAPSL